MREFGKNLSAECQTAPVLAPVLAMVLAFLAVLFAAYTGAADSAASSGLERHALATAQFAGKPCHHHHKSAARTAAKPAKSRQQQSHKELKSEFKTGIDGFRPVGDMCCEDENGSGSQQTALRLPRELIIAHASTDGLPVRWLLQPGGALTPRDVFNRSALSSTLPLCLQGQIASNSSATASQFTSTIRLMI